MTILRATYETKAAFELYNVHGDECDTSPGEVTDRLVIEGLDSSVCHVAVRAIPKGLFDTMVYWLQGGSFCWTRLTYIHKDTNEQKEVLVNISSVLKRLFAAGVDGFKLVKAVEGSGENLSKFILGQIPVIQTSMNIAQVLTIHRAQRLQIAEAWDKNKDTWIIEAKNKNKPITIQIQGNRLQRARNLVVTTKGEAFLIMDEWLDAPHISNGGSDEYLAYHHKNGVCLNLLTGEFKFNLNFV